MTGTNLTGAAAPVITRLARLGFAAKGIVTILIGALALRFALGLGGGITGPQGGIGILLNQPLGRTNLTLLPTGWRWGRLILGPVSAELIMYGFYFVLLMRYRAL